MTTQLFFRSAVSDFWTGNNDANLRGTATGWNSFLLSTARGASATSVVTSTVTGPTAGVECGSVPQVWYSPPLAAAATISGSVTWNLRAAESNMSANVASNAVLEVIDGATGAIRLIDATARVTEMAISTETADNFAETPAAGVVCKKGDRLRVRFYGDDVGTMGSGFTFTFWYNGPTAAASGDSYLTLTETLSFASEPAGSQLFPTDTGSITPVQTNPSLLSDFTGTNENPISEGGKWTRGVAVMQRLSNIAAAAAAVDSEAIWNTTVFGDVEAYVTKGDAASGMVVRVQNPGATYSGYRIRTTSTTVLVYPITAGSAGSTILNSAASVWATGDKIGVACHGNVISIYRWPSGGSAWAFVASVTTSTFPSSGYIGIYSTSATTGVDDFFAAATTGFFSGSPPTYVTREAWTSRGAGVQNDVTNTQTGYVAPIQTTDTAGGTAAEWYTKPLVATTISGAVRCNIRAQVSNVSATAAIRVEIARTDIDGGNPVTWAAGSFPTLLTASEVAQSFLISGDDLAITDGQRLRIRIFADDGAGIAGMASGQTVTDYYAGTSGGASGDTFVTLTQSLTELVLGVPRGHPPYAQHLAH